MCVVPRVTGATLAQAKRAITMARCSVGTVARAFSNTMRKGRVLAQRPRPGVKRGFGAKVDLVVSKGERKG
jgi:beta-lactam-binding protein with PASTA domain